MDSSDDQGTLSGKERKALRARAHGMKPVVWVAESGITPGAMREIDRALTAHELIKIHVALSGRAARDALLGEICTALGARPVQVIGKMLIAYRPRPQAMAPDESSNQAKIPKRGKRRAGKAASAITSDRNRTRNRRRPDS